MWRHSWAGVLKKLYLRSGSQRHRHFAGFFNVPVLHRHRTNLIIRWFRHTAPLVAFYDTLKLTDTSMTYCQSITQTLRIIWVRCIPLSLRSKTRLRATPLLPTWIYSCRSRVTVSCALPFMINVTISTSISQTFRSWVAIFHLRQCFYLTTHTVCQGLLLLWMFYSKGGATFT